MIFLPFAVPEMKASTRETVRLKTATSNPLLSMFSARFSPITANPMSPMSAAKSVSSYDSMHFSYHKLQEAMLSIYFLWEAVREMVISYRFASQ